MPGVQETGTHSQGGLVSPGQHGLKIEYGSFVGRLV